MFNVANYAEVQNVPCKLTLSHFAAVYIMYMYITVPSVIMVIGVHNMHNDMIHLAAITFRSEVQ